MPALKLRMFAWAMPLVFITQAVDVTDDPPDRVARLSYLTGDVSVRPGDADDWADASQNDPLSESDQVWVDGNGRAEIGLSAGAVRLGPNTAFSFLNLDDQMTQMRVSEGSVSLTLREVDEDDNVEVDAPNAAISLVRAGQYRVDVSADGDTTWVTVRAGEAEVTSGGSMFTVKAGQAASLVGTDEATYDVVDAPRPDTFDDWVVSRDRRWEDPTSSHYVSNEMVGYEDLDDAGDWDTVPEYGTVWYPRGVVADWAPYRHGHWRWVRSWGWTWVDDAPWGFAPFHYGRWARIRNRWAWVPGPIVRRPVYAPALVAFLGGSNWGVSVTVGGGPVGWFPLAPGEPFVPGYRASQRYISRVNVNITNVNVTNINYRNRAGGVTVVSRETFVHARPVDRDRQRIDNDHLTRATVAWHPGVQPGRESLIPVGARPVRRPPPAAAGRRVVVKTTPPRPPVPFKERPPVPQANGARPRGEVDNRDRARSSEPNPLVRPAPPAARPATPQLKPRRPGVPEPRPASPPSPEPPRRPPTSDQQRLEQQQNAERERIEREHQQQLRAKPAPDPTVKRRLSDEDRVVREKQRQAREDLKRREPPPKAAPQPKAPPPKATPPKAKPRPRKPPPA